MEITDTTGRRIAGAAMIMAAVGTVVGQLHAVARGQAHPGDFEESPLFAGWARPALDALHPLLDWADPWTVYVTYGKVWLPVTLAFTLAAVLVFVRRRPRGPELWLWRIQLGAYAVLIISVAGDYFTPWVDQSFVIGLIAMVIIGVGGVPLGIVLMRKGFRPRTSTILLMIFIPWLVVVAQITSLGSVLLPLAWGWAIAARTYATSGGVDRAVAVTARTAS